MERYIAPLDPRVERTHVRYRNRFGILLAGDLYTAKDMDRTARHAAIVIGAPYGGVKEQGPCVYAGELAALGRKACIVTGRHSSRQNGSLEDVLSALKAEGREWEVFDGIEENPSVETVVKAAQAGIRAQADFVIGIGGGSPLDAAKAVALLMASRQEWEADGLGGAVCCR